MTKPMTHADISKRGGKARMREMTSEQRSALARKGAKARWKNKKADEAAVKREKKSKKRALDADTSFLRAVTKTKGAKK